MRPSEVHAVAPVNIRNTPEAEIFFTQSTCGGRRDRLICSGYLAGRERDPASRPSRSSARGAHPPHSVRPRDGCLRRDLHNQHGSRDHRDHRLHPSGEGDPVKCLSALFTWCVNVPIAFVTLSTASLGNIRSADLRRASRGASLEDAPKALPAVTPGAAGSEDTPKYWETFAQLAATPGGAADVVPPSIPARPATGRHARPELQETALTNDQGISHEVREWV